MWYRSRYSASGASQRTIRRVGPSAANIDEDITRWRSAGSFVRVPLPQKSTFRARIFAVATSITPLGRRVQGEAALRPVNNVRPTRIRGRAHSVKTPLN